MVLIFDQCNNVLLLPKVVTLVVLMVSIPTTNGVGNNFNDEFEQTFGDHRLKIDGEGQASLILDQYSGAGFRSKKDYLFGRVDMPMKLVSGNSAGTVTTFYLTSDQSTGRHDEIDFEFLGNVSGEPYTLHTNIYTQGKGDREQQFHLWFDPTTAFHTYSILWNTRLIMFLVDEIPIRVFRANEDIGMPFPKDQPMRIQCSLWSAEWATQGGRIRTDWSKAPFIANYGKFKIDACIATGGKSSCTNVPEVPGSWRTHDLDFKGNNRLKWARAKYMIYDYCGDTKRFPQGVPPECKRD
ncbi:hypothetical protein RND81_14G048100 [Saponaria officinalis]|uniref:Xyloglucan endotransglucosylase/hydrolase n=1 Tax=Saponaria officinalis TaxID=3572 RepID=A0AAW1GSJ9_SAPOF